MSERGHLAFAALYYPEQLTAFWRGLDRRNGLRCQCSVDQIADGPSAFHNADGPSAFHNAERLCGRSFQSLMHSAEIIVGDIQRGGDMIVQLL